MTTSRIIQREFVIQPGYETLPSVTLDYAWSSFMNTYAVWPSRSGDSVTIRRTVELQRGYYYVTGAVDNFGTVNINGQYNITLYNFDANISRTSIGNSTRIYHGGGDMTILIQATNTGGPRGVAVTISRELETYTGRRTLLPTGTIVPVFEYETIRSIGDLVWSTRSPGTVTFGRYQVTMPFEANITAHVWGAGGGGGGLDPEGGTGSSGLYNTTFFNVARGDILEIFVGTGGSSAEPTIARRGSTPGGTQGLSRINITGVSSKSFNGGFGGRAGPAGWSGGGGAGGGASGVLVNEVPVIVAGGGGGGGGGGRYDTRASYQNASITNNATGAAGTDYRGESGSSKGVNEGGGDGGGGGGGGGGYPGGQGGGTPGGDVPGYAGQCGGNYPPFAASTGVNTPYYKSGFGGGSTTMANGQNGRVFLLIEPISLMSVKVAGEWKQINEGFVKVGGTWRDIDTVYIKIDDVWREINGTGQGDITLVGNAQNYGTSIRNYT